MQPIAALGIVCKTPRPGSAKTRLKGLFDGPDAVGLSAAFIRDVVGAVEAVPVAMGRQGYAVYAPEGSEEELKAIVPSTFRLLLQADQDFGVVLRSAADALLSRGHDLAILINSDSPTLPTKLLIDAIEALRAEGERVVLGPAADGGYYLIGLTRAEPALFEGVPWSTSDVLRRTLERAGSIGMPATLLPTWYDIDDPNAFATLERELAGRTPYFAAPGLVGGPAPATRAFLAERVGRLAAAAPSSHSGFEPVTDAG
jgi:uncharacterized protein